MRFLELSSESGRFSFLFGPTVIFFITGDERANSLLQTMEHRLACQDTMVAQIFFRALAQSRRAFFPEDDERAF